MHIRGWAGQGSGPRGAGCPCGEGVADDPCPFPPPLPSPPAAPLLSAPLASLSPPQLGQLLAALRNRLASMALLAEASQVL
jgi:hypothetical protein